VQQQRKEEAQTADPADLAIPKSSTHTHTHTQKERKKRKKEISQYTDKNNELHD